MKIIFLDIDGVLNSRGWYKRVRSEEGGGGLRLVSHLDPAAVGRVFRIVEASGARVVVSSSLRLTFGLPELRRALAQQGLPEEVVIDSTPNLGDRSRDEEIRHYLRQHAEDVDAFVILDDAADLNGLRSRQVRVNPEDGLLDKDVEEALGILSRA